MRTWLQRALWDVVPRNHRQSQRDLRRRQLITAGFVLVGAIVLGFSLRLQPGSTAFIVSSLVLASVWLVGAFASGPLHLGRAPVRDLASEVGKRPVVTPLALGFGLGGVFVVGGLVVAQVPWLAAQVASVISYANQGYLPVLVFVTAVNGIAEELFFRGALYAAITRYPVVWSSLAYTVATAATGNLMLSFAAALLGVLVGLQRRASGGILGPILTHVAWSMTMLLTLPYLFAAT